MGTDIIVPPLSTRLRTFLPYKLVDLLLFRQVRKIFGSSGRAKALLIGADCEKYSPEAIEEAIVNSTMKMVRNKIIQAHWDSLEYMYTEEGKHFLNPKNRAAVTALFPQLKS